MYNPAGVDEEVTIVMVLVYGGLVDDGSNDAEVSDGSPDAVRDTGLSIPLIRLTEMVFDPDSPCSSASPPELLIEKSKSDGEGSIANVSVSSVDH